MKKIVQKSRVKGKKRGGELDFLKNKVHPFSVKSSIYSFVILFLPLLFFSCGLASYPVLYDPLYQTKLTFQQNPDNKVNPDFISLGYDIIYRIYDNTDFKNDTIVQSDNIIQDEAANIVTSSILHTIISNNSYSGGTTGNTYSYNRLRYGDKSPIPIYKIDDSIPLDTYPIYLSLGSSEETSCIQDYYGNKINFTRNLGAETSIKKYFTISDFSTGDSDVPDNYDNADNDGVRIAFFAFTYGLTYDLLSLSGNIVYIGSQVIQL